MLGHSLTHVYRCCGPLSRSGVFFLGDALTDTPQPTRRLCEKDWLAVVCRVLATCHLPLSLHGLSVVWLLFLIREI